MVRSAELCSAWTGVDARPHTGGFVYESLKSIITGAERNQLVLYPT